MTPATKYATSLTFEQLKDRYKRRERRRTPAKREDREKVHKIAGVWPWQHSRCFANAD